MEDFVRILYNVIEFVFEIRYLVDKFDSYKGLIEKVIMEELIRFYEKLRVIEGFYMDYLF